MDYLTLILFFVYIYGLGYLSSFFVKESDNFIERLIMRGGIGLGVFSILSVVFNFLHIPLDYKVFLIIALVGIAFNLYKRFSNKELGGIKFKLKKSDIFILIVIVLFLFNFSMFHKGAFSYPYYEDGDPWGHAMSVEYISLEKTAYEPDLSLIEDERTRYRGIFQYIDPYPPAYDIFLGVLHQTSADLMWVIKFFNALLVSLPILFFYFFSKAFMKNRKKALFATFCLAMIPCFLSHFIWAFSLFMPIAIVSLYCLERIRFDKKWMYTSILVIAGLLVIQPTNSVKFGAMLFLYWIVKVIWSKESTWSKKLELKVFFANFFGLLLSFIFWWIWKGKEMFFRPPWLAEARQQLVDAGAFEKMFSFLKGALNPMSGTGSRKYTFGDFFISKSQNMINSPVGIGIILSILAIIGLVLLFMVYKKWKNQHWKAITVIWLIFTLIGVNSYRFPLGFDSFRFWMLLSIPVCLLAAEGFYVIYNSIKIKWAKWAFIIIIILLIFFTSGIQKYNVNTALWGGFGQQEASYLWLNEIPSGTNVFTFSLKHPPRVIGFGMNSCEWCPDVINYRHKIINESAIDILSWLRSHRYKYGIIDYYYVNAYGLDAVNAQIQQLIETEGFSVAYNDENMIVLKVK